MIGVKVKKKGTIEAASEAITAHWKAKGIDMTGFNMADGSGLSRVNTVTARQMALILYHATKSDGFEAFSTSLPLSGKSGTLRSIGRGTASEGRVRAKSGSIERVRAYCGYIKARSGKRYAFALLLNNFTASNATVRAAVVRIWNKAVAL